MKAPDFTVPGYWQNAGYFPIFFLLLACLYFVLRVDIYTLGGDQMRWIELIEKLYLGQFDLKDLWASHGSHRAPAYKAIFLLNARYFGLNMQYEQILGAFAWAGAAVVAVYGARQYLGQTQSNLAAIFVLVTIPFLIITGQVMPTVLSYSVISLRMFDMMCFFIVFYYLSRMLIVEPSLSRGFILSLMLVLFSLFIGRGWGQGMLLTVMFVLFAYATVNARNLTYPRIYKTLLPTAVTVIVCIYVYQIGLDHAGQKGASGFSALLDISSLISFSLTLLGRTLTIQHIDIKNGDNLILIQAVGGLVVALYAIATFTFFYKKQYRNGWFPLCLMVFSSAAVLLVYMGRGSAMGGGWHGALYPRHLPECSVGLVGALVILASDRESSLIVKRSIILACLILIASQTAAVSRSLYQTKFIIAHNTGKASSFFGAIQDFSSPDVVKRAGCHTEMICVYVRGVLDRYELMSEARQKVGI